MMTLSGSQKILILFWLCSFTNGTSEHSNTLNSTSSSGPTLGPPSDNTTINGTSAPANLTTPSSESQTTISVVQPNLTTTPTTVSTPTSVTTQITNTTTPGNGLSTTSKLLVNQTNANMLNITTMPPATTAPSIVDASTASPVTTTTTPKIPTTTTGIPTQTTTTTTTSTATSTTNASATQTTMSSTMETAKNNSNATAFISITKPVKPGKKMSPAVGVILGVVASSLFIAIVVLVYKYQRRFMHAFRFRRLQEVPMDDFEDFDGPDAVYAEHTVPIRLRF